MITVLRDAPIKASGAASCSNTKGCIATANFWELDQANWAA